MARKIRPPWEPSEEDYWRIFREQNPWHHSGTVPDAWAKRVERPLTKLLAGRMKADEPRRFQLILGSRRVGKTTSMYQVVKRLLAEGIDPKRLWWLRLDHPLLMDLPLGGLVTHATHDGKASPESPVFLFLDELTYAPKWDLWLKTFYDESWPIKVIGTSSSTAALKDRMFESGVGRWEEQYLAPYLFAEYLDLVGHPVPIPVEDTLSKTLAACIAGQIDVKPLAELRRRFLITGGFPELLIARQDMEDETSALLQSQRILRNDAIERAIYKDIPQAFNVDDPMLLERLLYTLAGQFTGLLSPVGICKDLGGLSQPTFDRYLSYLERAFLVFTLPNYSGSEASVQKRGRKLYFVDAAIRNAALQRGVGPLSDSSEMGLLLENMVAGHLRALSEINQVRLYHWRDHNDEIDLVFDHPEEPLAFEIGMSAGHHRRGIKAFEARFPKFAGRCYLVSPEILASLPEENWDGIGTMPIDLFLLAVGGQMEKELARRLTPRSR
jgi:uncharacterized protein